MPTYNALCNILRSMATSALKGSLTLDGWSAALVSPILRLTWNYIDDRWNLRPNPVTMLHTGDTSKSAEQLGSIVEGVLNHRTRIGLEKLMIHTITSENEASVSLSVDLLTTFQGLLGVSCTRLRSVSTTFPLTRLRGRSTGRSSTA